MVFPIPAPQPQIATPTVGAEVAQTGSPSEEVPAEPSPLDDDADETALASAESASEATLAKMEQLQEESVRKIQNTLKLRNDVAETLRQQALTERQAAAEQQLNEELFALQISMRGDLELALEEQDQKTQESFELQRKMADLDDRLATLEQTRQWLGQSRPRATVLENVPTPISKNVEDMEKEIHFRLLNGHISFVPIHELNDLVVRMITAEKRPTSKQELRGVVGPVAGYSMEYVIATYDALVRDAYGVSLNQRTGFIQAVYVAQPGLEEWPLHESLDNPQSPFLQRLQKYRADIYTITVWVYPDSFESFRELKQFLHDRGYRVAAWPRAAGQPISAGSDGHQSVAQ